MKILLINDFGYPVGGAESYFLQLADALKTRGHEVVTLSSDSTRHGSTFVTDYRIRHSGHWFDADSVFNPVAYYQFRRVLRKIRPEIVHLQNIFYTLSPSILFALKQDTAVMTLHDYFAICAGDKRLLNGAVCCAAFGRECAVQGCLHGKSFALERFKRAIIRRGLANVSCLLAPSRFLREEFIRNGYSSVELLNHPCNQFGHTEPSAPDTAKTGVVPNGAAFIYIGRLAEQKGVSVLLKAFKQVLAASPEATLTIVGSGPLDGSLKAEAESLRLGTAVTFTGQVTPERVNFFLSRSLAAVMPSIWPEVAGLAMYEAAACGVPAIAADIGGIPEFVSDRQTGLLFPPGDSAALAEKMLWLAQHPEQAAPMRQQLQERLRDYTWERHVERLEHIYSKASNSGQRE